MSRSYWLPFCAAVGIILGASSYGQYQAINNGSGSAGKTANIQTQPKYNLPPNLPIAVQHNVERIASALETANTNNDALNKAQDYKRYLQSQIRLARWGFIMLLIAGLETAVTALGVWLVWKTLGAARTSATAAQGTLKVITDNAQRELRAYITVEPVGIIQLILNIKTVGQVAVKNVGRTPARNVSVHVRMALGHEGRDNFDVVESKETINRVIQPNGEMRQGSQDEIPVNDIISWRDYIFVWGIVNYTDGFGAPRFTRFCHRYWAGSFDRSIDLLIAPPEVRTVIKVQSARYHLYGNNAD